MFIADVASLLPLIIVGGAIVVILLAAAFSKEKSLSWTVTWVGLAAAFVSLFFIPSQPAVSALLVMDRYAAFYMGLIFASALSVVLLSRSYFLARPSARTMGASGSEASLVEYHLLLLLATLGSAILVASRHFASFFLGLELLSVSLYALISYRRESSRGIEAGIKYLILAGSSSAFLLFGMALVYGAFGTMEFLRLGVELSKPPGGDPLALTGASLLLVGIGFKLSFAPFHIWAPDIYEGAPAPVSAFIATVSKGAVFALLVRFLMMSRLYPGGTSFTILNVLAIASMVTGNFLALRQNNFKRLLAYSSIAHLGYLLVALMAGGPFGINAVGFYLLSYFVTTLIAFGVISVLSRGDRDADLIRDYQGLFWRRPLLAAVLSAAILSLAGIPLTAGFVSKFYLVSSGVKSALWTSVAVLIASSAVGLYYYLRVIIVLFAPWNIEVGRERAAPSGMLSGSATLGVLGILLVWVGVFPSPFLQLIQRSMSSFGR